MKPVVSPPANGSGVTRGPGVGAPGGITTVKASPGQGPEVAIDVSYSDLKPIGNGSFGVVYQARLCDNSGDFVAIKKVLQDKRFKNRELQIMKKVDHPNIVRLRYYFYSTGDKKDEIYLNLVLEFVPETVYRVARHYTKLKQTLPIIYVKVYLYQLFRSLAYIHSLGICHRDIKPQNLLLDPETSILKLCDFGSAKVLTRGEQNVSYICSRYYRAPELIFGANDYTVSIDIWSAGCVMAELLLGQPIFPGESGVDQLVEIIKVLGTPTKEQIKEMNPNYTEFKFPQIAPNPWSKVFRSRTPQTAIALIARLLEYSPSKRITPMEALAHAFFDELRDASTRLPNGRELPSLFNFTPMETQLAGPLADAIIPPHARMQLAASSVTNAGGGQQSSPPSTSSSANVQNVAATTAGASSSRPATSSSATDPGVHMDAQPSAGNAVSNNAVASSGNATTVSSSAAAVSDGGGGKGAISPTGGASGNGTSNVVSMPSAPTVQQQS